LCAPWKKRVFPAGARRAVTSRDVLDREAGRYEKRGTRMPVTTIFENLGAGASLDDILCWIDGLDPEQVKVVIDFAARSLEAPAPTR